MSTFLQFCYHLPRHWYYSRAANNLLDRDPQHPDLDHVCEQVNISAGIINEWLARLDALDDMNERLIGAIVVLTIFALIGRELIDWSRRVGAFS